MKLLSLGTTGLAAVCLLSPSAVHANSLGKTGFSGKQGMTCATCHTTGAGVQAPTVEFSGPTSLTAGQTGQYALIIRGGPGVKGGMNVAVSNTAASLEPGTGLKKAGSEITHSVPKAFASGEVRFDFSLVAPSTNGTLTLYGVGNSVDGDGDSTGDAVATATLDISVTGGSSGGTDGGTNPPDAGTNPPEDDDEGGCSATGGAPILLFALLGAGLFRRRRD